MAWAPESELLQSLEDPGPESPENKKGFLISKRRIGALKLPIPFLGVPFLLRLLVFLHGG